jgi:hypothetical protein
MHIDPQYFSLPCSNRAHAAVPATGPGRRESALFGRAPRGWPAFVAPSMGMLHDLVLSLSLGWASVSVERLSEDPVLRISLDDDRRGLEVLRGALLRSLSDRGFEETEPGLLQRQDQAGLSLVGVGAVTADAATGLPAFELWGFDGVPVEADAQAMDMEAVS